MAVLLNKKVCQVACVLAVVASLSAIATTICGFINMGTYHATYLEASVGVWVGLLMFVHVFMGLAMLGTRHIYTGAIYLLTNFVCLGLGIYGIVISSDYYYDFKTFREYNDGKNGSSCVVFTTGTCACIVNKESKYFKNGYAVPKCALFSFGEDLWLATLILVSSCVLWAFVGTIVGFASVFVGIKNQEEKAESNNKRSIYEFRDQASFGPQSLVM